MNVEIGTEATLKKKKNFPIFKGSQKSNIRLTASTNMVKYLRASSYIREPFLMYDFATDPIWISGSATKRSITQRLCHLT